MEMDTLHIISTFNAFKIAYVRISNRSNLFLQKKYNGGVD